MGRSPVRAVAPPPQIPSALARVIARAFGLAGTTRACNRMGPRTIRRQQPDRNAWRALPPRLDRLGLRAFVVLHPPREALSLWGRRGRLAHAAHGTAAGVCVPCPQAVPQAPRGDRERAGQGVRRLLPRGPDRSLGPWGQPRLAALWEPGAIAGIRTDPPLPGLQRRDAPPAAGAARRPWGSGLLCHARGPRPSPAPCVAPSPPRRRRDRAPTRCLEGDGAGRTAPARAVPAGGPRRRRAPRQERPLQRRGPSRRAPRRAAGAVGCTRYAQGARPGGRHETRHTGASTAHAGGDRAWRPFGRTPESPLAGAQRAIARASAGRQPLCVRRWGHSQYGGPGQSRGSAIGGEACISSISQAYLLCQSHVV